MNVIYVRTCENQPPSKGHTFAKLCYKIPRVTGSNNTFSCGEPRKYLPRFSRGFSLTFSPRRHSQNRIIVIFPKLVILTRNIILDILSLFWLIHQTFVWLIHRNSSTFILQRKFKQSLHVVHMCIFYALCAIICLPQTGFNNLMNSKWDTVLVEEILQLICEFM